MTCEETQLTLGVYVLGALDPAEAAAVEDHLSGCDRCRAVHAEIRGFPSLLSLVPAEHAELVAHGGAPRPSDTGLRRLLKRVRAERAAERSRQRRRGVLLAAVAAVVLFLAVGGGAWTGARWLAPESGSEIAGPPPSGPTVIWRGANPETGVSAEATLSQYGWGIKVDAVMNGMHPGDICLIRVVDDSGKAWDAGSWEVGDRTKDLRWAGDVGVFLKQVDRVEIWDGATDRRLVTLAG